ncbi:endonuclease V, partial [Candidatus Woesearchaeota archaeon]|nr:endonuclease V [Candidatus Woesearchaeota archaeon]
VDKEKLKKEQLELASKIVTIDSFKKAKLIGGVDVAYVDSKAVCSIVICDSNMNVIESQTAVGEVAIPYMPGYLFYREGPIIIETYQKIENKPDVLLCGFHGILHPRRIGAASQLGLVLDVPTIGVAKNIFCGKLKGDTVIIDKEAIGTRFVTKEHAKPIFISPGHKISLKKSIEIVKNCLRMPHKLPEPLHLAHQNSNKEKKTLTDSG